MKLPSGYMNPYKIVAPLTTKGLAKSWSHDEIQKMLMYAKEKKRPDEIAKKLNRSASDIKSKLKTIAADMYMKDKLPYDKIHETTGVEKDTIILTPSMYKNYELDTISDIEYNDSDHVVVDVSIYEFPDDTEIVSPNPNMMIDIDIKDTSDEVLVTVSMESPFSVKSICDNISTPILTTFTTCSRFAKKITGLSEINQSLH